MKRCKIVLNLKGIGIYPMYVTAKGKERLKRKGLLNEEGIIHWKF